MRFQKLSFENREGQRLSARLDLPLDQKPIAYAIFAHCFTCTKNLTAVVNIDKALASRGIAVLRFDFTGLGESEGEFADTNFSSNVSDLTAAAEFLAEHSAPPKLLIGHSLGGAAVLHAAAQIESCTAVATIAAPSSPSGLNRFLREKAEQIEAKGEAEFTLAGRKFRLKRQFLNDLQRVRMKDKIAGLGKALLIFHSPRDEIVPIENAREIFETARHPKSFISLDGADHLLSNRKDSGYVGSLLAVWARRYIDSADHPQVTRTASTSTEPNR